MDTRENKSDKLQNEINQVDSPINTSDAQRASDGKSLTNDESANSDPNRSADKASFEPNDINSNDRTRFDGDINI